MELEKEQIEQIKGIIKQMPHRLAMKKYRINDVRFLDKSLNKIKAQITDLEEQVYASTPPESVLAEDNPLYGTSRLLAVAIINAYMPPEELAELNKNKATGNSTTEPVNNDPPPTPPGNGTTEPVNEPTPPGANEPAPNVVNKEQRIQMIKDILNKTGFISLTQLTEMGVTVAPSTTAIKIDDSLTIVRAVSDSEFTVEKKSKNILGKVLLFGGILFTIGGLIVAATSGGKKK